ncbi:type II toxin-antitoxin system PemK/MazF family toxin [Paenibacillus hamazuiensis]|uniref:type II toxin-antitoxin system PemK/MazF family toxin n=1 Tax=Paenibacillus hamazuiensis TaxID=2936508 RepID=UPI00200C82A3|nr:type II toxin-antitoxin system PemK/MazF family toxin [Paenibacillus hamazuiensis]
MSKYNELKDLNEKSKEILLKKAESVISQLKQSDFVKGLSLIEAIPNSVKQTYDSIQLNTQRPKEGKEKKQHPIKPIRGQIYNAFIGENVGSELSGEHPVIIIQNTAGNLFAQKVNVLPIEGDGNVVKEPYQVKLTSDDLEDGVQLLKDPSRVIISDVLTIDKAKLGIKVGKIKDEKMKKINECLMIQLELDKK